MPKHLYGLLGLLSALIADQNCIMEHLSLGSVYKKSKIKCSSENIFFSFAQRYRRVKNKYGGSKNTSQRP